MATRATARTHTATRATARTYADTNKIYANHLKQASMPCGPNPQAKKQNARKHNIPRETRELMNQYAPPRGPWNLVPLIADAIESRRKLEPPIKT